MVNVSIVFLALAIASTVMVGVCTLITNVAFSALVGPGRRGVSVTEENYEWALRSSGRRARIAGTVFVLSSTVSVLGLLFTLSRSASAVSLLWTLVLLSAGSFVVGTILVGWSLMGGRMDVESPGHDRPETEPMDGDR